MTGKGKLVYIARNLPAPICPVIGRLYVIILMRAMFVLFVIFVISIETKSTLIAVTDR